MTEAVREQTHQHRCVCILGEEGSKAWNACFATVRSPDQPFCSPCEETGHHHQYQVMDSEIRMKADEGWRQMNQGRQ